MPKAKSRPSPAKSAREKRAESRSEETLNDLSAIYSVNEGREDLTRLDRNRQPVLKRVLIGLLSFFAVLTAVSWAGFFLFSPTGGKFSGEGVTLAAEGPGEVKTGELVTYVFRWNNGERVPLGTASLKLRLPREFELRRADPAMTEDKWDIGSLSPGKGGEVRIQGVFFAPKDAGIDLQAILTYHPADFNSEFQRVATKPVVIAGSLLDFAAAGPAKVMPGDKVELNFNFENRSDRPFAGIKVKVAYPTNFLPDSAVPPAADATFTEWTVPSLAPAGKGVIAVTGSFASDARGKNVIHADIGVSDKDGRFLPQGGADCTADIVEGNLVTNLILNGSADAQTVNFGDTQRYAVTWRNTGSSVLTDAAFTVRFETLPADKEILRWNDIKDQEQGVRDGNSITWNKKQVSALGRLAPGEEGTIDFELPLKDKPFDGTVGQPYSVNAWVEAAVGAIDGQKVNRTAKSQPVLAKILSDASLSCDGRYFNDDGIPVGSGLLPPKVGEPTTYRVTCTVANTLHELSDLKLSAKLPPNVIWTGKSNVDAGDLRFDAASEKLLWTLNWLPTTIKQVAISFDAAITPSEDQAGKVPTLIDAAILEATDKVAGAKLLLSAPPLTTALENDASAEGKARVQK